MNQIDDVGGTPSPDVLLVVGLCSQRGRSSEPYRGYMLETAKEYASLWLFDVPGQSWQDPHVVGKTDVDVFDVDATVAAAQELARRQNVVGVWGPDEATTPAAAAVAEALGLPGPGRAAVERARDKATTREVLTAAGLPQPRSVAVASFEEARQIAADWGYPLVMKPRALGASLGVVKVNGPDDLESAYTSARNAVYAGLPTIARGVLIEEYLDGDEVSIDGYFDGERYTPLGLAEKTLAYAPYFEEGQHVVAGDRPIDPAITDVVAQAHRALGLGSLVSHTEVRLTHRGLVVIEVNVRPGGDFIPMLVERATGVGPHAVSVQAALGRRLDLRPNGPLKNAAIRFVYVPHDGVFEEVTGLDSLPEGVEYLRLAAPGTPLFLPPRGYLGRVGAIVAAGSVEETKHLLDLAEGVLKVRVSEIVE